MPEALLQPSRIGAPGSINAHTLNGRFVPAYTHFILTHPATTYSPATDRLHYYVGAIETKAPAGTGGQPRQYAAVARSVFRLDSGTITDDLVNFQGTHDAFNDVVQGMVICNGPPDDTAGTVAGHTAVTEATMVPVLLVTFGTGKPNPDATTEIGCYYRVLSSDSSTPWNEATAASGLLTAWQIIKAGPDLYAACDAGVAGSLGDWRVSKCPAGSNPVLAANWGNGVEVGTPEWIITGMAAIGASPVVGKPDGLYYYNQITRRYENVLKHYEIVPHALNGKVTQAVTGGVVYTTFDGGAYFFDGVAVQEISPKKLWKLLGKDVANARITAVADMGDSIFMLPELGAQTTQNAGLQIIRTRVADVTDSVDVTANAVDGSLATGIELDSMTTGDTLDIFADIPFEAGIFHTTRAANGTPSATIDTVSYTSANDAWTAFSGFIDGTRLTGNATTATAGGSFSYVAFPPSASAGMVMPTNINAGSLVQRVNVAYNGGALNVTNKYGMRLTITGTLDSETEVDEIEIVPFRAGMPNSDGGLYTATTNYTSRHRSGLTQSVYELRRTNTTGFVAHDSYTVDSYGGTWAMSAHAGRLGQASGGQNLGQSLVLWGRYRTVAISFGPTRDPGRDIYPITVQTSSTKPGPLCQIMHDWDGGDRTRLKTLDWLSIETVDLQPLDKWEVFFQHDNMDIVSVAKGEGGPLNNLRPPQTAFRYLNAWLGVTRNSTTGIERAPQFLEPMRLSFQWADQIMPKDRAQQTPIAT